MKTFQDQAGRTWSIRLNVDVLKRVRALCEVDLMDAAQGTLLERLIGDPILLCDVVYAVCKEEADTKGVSDIQFGQSMAGDAIEDATKALLGELVDFFPSARRALLAKALEKLRRWEELAIQTGMARLEAPETEEAFQRELDHLGKSSISLRASRESTPAPSHYANLSG